MRTAQGQTLQQDGFVQLYAFEVGIDGLACSVFQPRRGFDLRFYPGDGADVGVLILRQLLSCLGDSVQIVDDDVGVKKGDHVYLLGLLVTHGALQG